MMHCDLCHQCHFRKFNSAASTGDARCACLCFPQFRLFANGSIVRDNHEAHLAQSMRKQPFFQCDIQSPRFTSSQHILVSMSIICKKLQLAFGKVSFWEALCLWPFRRLGLKVLQVVHAIHRWVQVDQAWSFAQGTILCSDWYSKSYHWS